MPGATWTGPTLTPMEVVTELVVVTPTVAETERLMTLTLTPPEIEALALKVVVTVEATVEVKVTGIVDVVLFSTARDSTALWIRPRSRATVYVSHGPV